MSNHTQLELWVNSYVHTEIFLRAASIKPRYPGHLKCASVRMVAMASKTASPVELSAEASKREIG